MRQPGVAALLCLTLAGCQTYEFQRVEPFAVAQTTQRTVVANRRLKPNIMLLVDNSTSMLLPTDPLAAACPTGCGQSRATPCPAACPTRVSELKSAMQSFLATSGQVARFGLTVFPEPPANDQQSLAAQCTPTDRVRVPLPAPTPDDEGTGTTLDAQAAQVAGSLVTLDPLGGTPTSASLQFVGQLPGLNERGDARPDFVLLLTDGLPNCSETNTAGICDCLGAGCSQARLDACACTQSSCSDTRCARGCLDDDGAVEAVRALRQRDIQTIVVGFGADLTSGTARDVLQAMAEEGGHSRRCGGQIECGVGCDADAGTCTNAFYSASTGAQLASALRAISAGLPVNACEFRLEERPSQPRFLAVLVDGVSLTPGADTYSYDEARNAVTFHGDFCRRIEASTPLATVDVEFRIVEAL